MFKQKPPLRFPQVTPLFHETYLQAVHRQKLMLEHWHRVDYVQPAVDDGPPLRRNYSNLKLRKFLEAGVRRSRIEKENKILLSLIMKAMEGPAAVDHIQKVHLAKHHALRSFRKKQREVTVINRENKRLLGWIKKSKTSYDHIEMELDYQAKIRSRRGRSYVYRLWEEKAVERKAALMAGKVEATSLRVNVDREELRKRSMQTHGHCQGRERYPPLHAKPVPAQCRSPEGTGPTDHRRCLISVHSTPPVKPRPPPNTAEGDVPPARATKTTELRRAEVQKKMQATSLQPLQHPPRAKLRQQKFKNVNQSASPTFPEVAWKRSFSYSPHQCCIRLDELTSAGQFSAHKEGAHAHREGEDIERRPLADKEFLANELFISMTKPLVFRRDMKPLPPLKPRRSPKDDISLDKVSYGGIGTTKMMKSANGSNSDQWNRSRTKPTGGGQVEKEEQPDTDTALSGHRQDADDDRSPPSRSPGSTWDAYISERPPCPTKLTRRVSISRPQTDTVCATRESDRTTRGSGEGKLIKNEEPQDSQGPLTHGVSCCDEVLQQTEVPADRPKMEAPGAMAVIKQSRYEEFPTVPEQYSDRPCIQSANSLRLKGKFVISNEPVPENEYSLVESPKLSHGSETIQHLSRSFHEGVPSVSLQLKLHDPDLLHTRKFSRSKSVTSGTRRQEKRDKRPGSNPDKNVKSRCLDTSNSMEWLGKCLPEDPCAQHNFQAGDSSLSRTASTSSLSSALRSASTSASRDLGSSICTLASRPSPCSHTTVRDLEKTREPDMERLAGSFSLALTAGYGEPVRRLIFVDDGGYTSDDTEDSSVSSCED